MKQITLMLIAVAVMTSCGTTKQLSKSFPDEQIVTEAIPADKYPDTQNTIYAIFTGTSIDINTAKQISRTYCRGELAQKITSRIIAATESYAKQYDANTNNNTKRDFNGNFETTILNIAQAELSGTSVVEEIITRNTKTNEYTSWVAMKLPLVLSDKFINSITENIPAQYKAQIDANRNAFRQYIQNNIQK